MKTPEQIEQERKERQGFRLGCLAALLFVIAWYYFITYLLP